MTIGPDGTVSVQVEIRPLPTQVGQFRSSNFLNPAGLQPMGQNLYKQTQASGPPQTGIAGGRTVSVRWRRDFSRCPTKARCRKWSD